MIPLHFRLKESRKSRGLTQVEVCKILFVDQNSLSLFENGHRLPRVDMIEKLANLYDVNPAWLVGWSDNSERESIRKQD